MRIGELARQSGVPATALRYYEKAGLLPIPRRTESGYRAYDDEALRRLEFIRAAQAVGLKLTEIREAIAIRERGSSPCQHVLELIERRRAEVASRIAELQRLDRDLARVAQQGNRLNPADCQPWAVCGVIPVDGVNRISD
ncbi:MAG: heavy metal-responsive transcriptional regulator [Chloroflexota bacterium]|nr:heavy metal-responsive transcriptional regulator [Chloroflexota bacterium]